MKPKALIFAGYGLNCDEETKFGFELAGIETRIAHINDVILGHFKLSDFQILVFQGGFSYGDDTGSGNAYGLKVKNHLWYKLVKFLDEDKLVIGICNGFQILVNIGLLPGFKNENRLRKIALMPNISARYTVRFTDLKVETNISPWLTGITKISLPIAHGEGRLWAPENILKDLIRKKMIGLRYTKDEMSNYLDLSANPNGSIDNIAGIVSENGRILGLMPHPERAIFFQQLPNFYILKEKYNRSGRHLPKYGPGLKIFRNAAKYFD